MLLSELEEEDDLLIDRLLKNDLDPGLGFYFICRCISFINRV